MITQSLFFILAINLISVNSQQKGEPCTVQKPASSGVCKLITDCPKALSNLQNGRDNTPCGYDGLLEVVCCPNPKVVEPEEPTSNRISQKKCAEYSQAIYKYEESKAPNVDSEGLLLKVDKCGHKMIPLVVGGELTNPREFPHMALVGYDSVEGKSWSCGGSLISDQHVLTAGHCTKTLVDGDPKYVRLGDLDISRDDDDAEPEEYNIAEVISYKDYDPKKKYHDIAILKLDRKVVLSPYKVPICLPSTYEGRERKAIATGWGHTEWSGHSSNQLQKVILDKFTHTECNTSYIYSINRKLEHGITYDTQMCAGSRSEAKDTCQGDSGGPLQVFHPTQYCMYTIVGVTSFGIACGSVGIPGVYTRVFSYLDWIEENVWKGE